MSKDASPVGDHVIAARVQDDDTVPCVGATGFDTMGWVSPGTELVEECVLEQILSPYNSSSGPETNCGDGWDNDCDGLADGADPDCKGKAPEQCANGIDDDLNGKVDCADDAGCATFPSCRHK